MPWMRKAHIVVVGDGSSVIRLAARLRLMAAAQVTAVASIAEARDLCRQGVVTACIVVQDEDCLDRPPLDGDAPGRDAGVPSLAIVPAVTSWNRKTARRGGYTAVLPADIAGRLLRRRLGAALQRRRKAGARTSRQQRTDFDRRRLPKTAGSPALNRAPVLWSEKPTFH